MIWDFLRNFNLFRIKYDETEDIVDVFVYRDPYCPYPYTITNTSNIVDI